MDLELPMRSIIPTVEAEVLFVLSRTTELMSGAEIHRLTPGNRSVRGVQNALNRLAREGLVHKIERSNLALYKRNDWHLAWPAIELLAGMGRAMEEKIAELVAQWQVPPLSVSIFGSGARRDGNSESDIDVLIIDPVEGLEWDSRSSELDEFSDHLMAATGNLVQVLNLTTSELAEYVVKGEPIVLEWKKDARLLAGTDIRVLIREVQV